MRFSVNINETELEASERSDVFTVILIALLEYMLKRSECTCPCHEGAQILHFVPCCEPDTDDIVSGGDEFIIANGGTNDIDFTTGEQALERFKNSVKQNGK